MRKLLTVAALSLVSSCSYDLNGSYEGWLYPEVLDCDFYPEVAPYKMSFDLIHYEQEVHAFVELSGVKDAEMHGITTQDGFIAENTIHQDGKVLSRILQRKDDGKTKVTVEADTNCSIEWNGLTVKEN